MAIHLGGQQPIASYPRLLYRPSDHDLRFDTDAGGKMTRLIWLTAIPWMVVHIATASAAAPACDPTNPSQVRLQVNVSGIRTTKGQIDISVYPDAPKEFLKARFKLEEQHLPVVLPVTHACFALPAPGEYGVALFGDENDNDHFDLTVLGVPAEGYGFSNNPRLYFGPPGLGRVLFPAHAGDNQVAVTMQYYP